MFGVSRIKVCIKLTWETKDFYRDGRVKSMNGITKKRMSRTNHNYIMKSENERGMEEASQVKKKKEAQLWNNIQT